MCIRDRTNPDGFADEDRPKLADPMSMVITEVSIVDVSAGASAPVSYTHLMSSFLQRRLTSRSLQRLRISQ